MNDSTDLGASYCPACGTPVAQAQSVNADDGLVESAQGVYEKSGAHVVIDGSVVSVYVHGDTEEIATDGGESA